MGFSSERLKKLELAALKTVQQDVVIDHETFEITFLCDEGKKYIPSETAKKFHAENARPEEIGAVVKFVRGPYGSGKTTFNCMDLLLYASRMPRCKDGVRYIRTLIFRNTFDQLKRGIYDTWTEWFGKLGQTRPIKGNRLEFKHKFNDGFGLIDWDVWFIAMDKMTDPSKVKSFNATNALLNEASELPISILTHLPARLGRYPTAQMIDDRYVEEKYKKPKKLNDGTLVERCKYLPAINGDTNPCDTRDALYKLFEIDRPDGYKIFKQPPGLIEKDDGTYIPNPKCDNYGVGISQDYYLKQVAGHTKEFIKVYCQGEYGIYVPGKAVYDQYNDDIHSVDDIDFDPNHPVLFQFDGGFTPACLISQLVDGQLRAIKEFTTDRMFLEEFVEYVVVPFSASQLAGYAYETTGDPAITEREVLEMEKNGFDLIKPRTNKIEPRVQAQASYLNKMIGGQPAFVLSRKGCPELRAGFIGEYNFKQVRSSGENKYTDIPDKTHPTSDIHDCAQYGALHFTQNEGRSRDKPDFTKFINRDKY